jgi:predicted ATPase
MLIHEIRPRNLLSFGPDTAALPLGNLNVLIGPNGSGKSNLIETIGLLQAAPTHLAAPVREGGGIRDWIWKGDPRSTASLDVVVDYPKSDQALRHVIEFKESAQRFELISELIADADTSTPGADVKVYFRIHRGKPRLRTRLGRERHLQRTDVTLDESILSQIKDPNQYPEITWLGSVYPRMRLHREWWFGRCSPLRQPQKADQPNDFLVPDGTNLGLVLNRLGLESSVKRPLLENLRELYDGIEDYQLLIEGGTVQVFLQESGFTIPATRLSDGTLRYLCLLAILCHPSPPPLVCIEGPELGLHPDVLPTIARLLQEAATKTQLVVTTHSDILIDQFSETPESVVVCERSEGQTTMKRLDRKQLGDWLEKYRLGELWTKGEIGGARW